MPFRADAPGSLMLLGEYAVLYGKHALVCAIDKRMTVTLTPRIDNQIHIDGLDTHYQTTLAAIQIKPPFQFVLGCLKQYQPVMPCGCDIQVVAEFSDQVGFGSSAAVTAATLAALVTWLNIPTTAAQLIGNGCKVIRAVQGVGSGADIAAAVHGGIVIYQASPLRAEKLSITYPLTALYAGFKTPTAIAIKQVERHFATSPALFRCLIQAIDQCAIEGQQAIRQLNWSQLGKIMTIQQGIMQSIGVSSVLLNNLVASLQNQQAILGAKISGSGLGDCVIGLGASNIAHEKQMPVQMTLQGVGCEKT
jgi:mevalonate kinase